MPTLCLLPLEPYWEENKTKVKSKLFLSALDEVEHFRQYRQQPVGWDMDAETVAHSGAEPRIASVISMEGPVNNELIEHHVDFTPLHPYTQDTSRKARLFRSILLTSQAKIRRARQTKLLQRLALVPL
jgi:uncharacterized protein YueI